MSKRKAESDFSKEKQKPGVSSFCSSLPNSVIAEIFSYNVSDHRDLARLRLISNSFNNDIFPYISRCKSCRLKCTTNKDSNSQFLKELCEMGGSVYDDNDEFRGCTLDLSKTDDEFEMFSAIRPTMQSPNSSDVFILKPNSLLIVSDFFRWENVVGAPEHGDLDTMRELCQSLIESKSFKEFITKSEDAFRSCLFLPPYLKSYKDGDEGYFEEKIICATIMSVSLPKEAKGYTPGDVIDIQMMSNVDSITDFDISPRECDVGLPFRGYVDKTGYEIHIPVFMWIKYGIHWSGDYSTNNLQMIDFQNRHLNSLFNPEGISIVDGAIPRSLHVKLKKQIDDFADKQEVDYHPHSKDIVRDIIHPALYSYIKGESLVSVDLLEDEVPPCSFHVEATDSEGEDVSQTTEDYWGRSYEESIKYQWMSTYFDIDSDGVCKICDYINNLGPRTPENTDLYSSLEQLFSHALPQLESVYSYARAIKPHIRIQEDEEMDYNPRLVTVDTDRHYSLRNQRLQVITKIVDYEFDGSPSSSKDAYEGVWHVEGMSHEEIVATAIYFLHRDSPIEGGNIAFKRSFLKEEATYIFSNTSHEGPRYQYDVIQEGLLTLGQVETLANRLLVFPNSHVHKVRKMFHNSDKKPTSESETEVDKKKKAKISSSSSSSSQKEKEKSIRRIVVFFLVNPKKRIISSREIMPQQKAFGGKISHEKALEHRLELMKERKYTKQDWNVRAIELCEH